MHSAGPALAHGPDAVGPGPRAISACRRARSARRGALMRSPCAASTMGSPGKVGRRGSRCRGKPTMRGGGGGGGGGSTTFQGGGGVPVAGDEGDGVL
jgi:hypothetical protein